MKSPIYPAFLVMITVICFHGAEPAQAQSIFLEPNNLGSVHLEALRPGFGGQDLSTLTFALFLSGRIQAGEIVQIRGEIPYMTYKEDGRENYYGYTPPSQGKNALGNPYVGLDVGRSRKGFQGEFGIRIPVVKDNSGAEAEGLATDPVERMEAFIRDIMPIYLGVNYRYRSDIGFALRIRLVPVVWFYTGSGSQDTDIFALYSAQAWYETEKVGVGGGFSGRLIATGDAEGFGERSFHQFGFFANYAFGSFLPGFQVRFPLDKDLKDYFIPAYSFSIGVKL